MDPGLRRPSISTAHELVFPQLLQTNAPSTVLGLSSVPGPCTANLIFAM